MPAAPAITAPRMIEMETRSMPGTDKLVATQKPVGMSLPSHALQGLRCPMRVYLNPGEIFALDAVLQRLISDQDVDVPILSAAAKVKAAIRDMPKFYPELATDAS